MKEHISAFIVLEQLRVQSLLLLRLHQWIIENAHALHELTVLLYGNGPVKRILRKKELRNKTKKKKK
jgi:hypothetical protein